MVRITKVLGRNFFGENKKFWDFFILEGGHLFPKVNVRIVTKK